MKYYSEDETRELRQAFEEHVLNWKGVTKKKMFGCPCYKANEKLFAFLVTNGIVITKLQSSDREELASEHQTSYFQAGKKTVKNWLKIPIKKLKQLNTIMPFVKKSYQEALLKE